MTNTKTSKTEEKEKNTSKEELSVKEGLDKTKTLDKQENNEPEKEDINKQFRVGDTIKVNYKIIEAGKERIQPFEGVVIGKKGAGISKTFTVRKIGDRGVGVERIFPVYSPKIASLEVTKKGKVRRSKLYYLRQQRSKKEAKIKERV